MCLRDGATRVRGDDAKYDRKARHPARVAAVILGCAAPLLLVLLVELLLGDLHGAAATLDGARPKRRSQRHLVATLARRVVVVALRLLLGARAAHLGADEARPVDEDDARDEGEEHPAHLPGRLKVGRGRTGDDLVPRDRGLGRRREEPDGHRGRHHSDERGDDDEPERDATARREATELAPRRSRAAAVRAVPDLPLDDRRFRKLLPRDTPRVREHLHPRRSPATTSSRRRILIGPPAAAAVGGIDALLSPQRQDEGAARAAAAAGCG
mmetsp:Transcript_71571/g.215133  ORF Transcript_71571/g.215133 Transcript_71571/m.215133 type:complete len:269 (-) Transcript_71571:45-851(-)